MITFKNVSKVYEGKTQTVTALQNIQITIEKGDIFGVIGYSGAGKSTLIRTVNLLEKPTTGEVLVEGENLANLSKRDLREAQKRIGMIFQHFHLLESKTVYENVALPLVLSKVNKHEIEERVKETLAFVGLGDKIDNYPDQLSGGQKQRVGIARALVTKPSILLCDEATSALDPQTTTDILELLKKVNEEYQITILLITHEMDVIKEICNRVAVMENGRIVETGNVYEVFAQPKTTTTKKFVQSTIQQTIPESIYSRVEEGRFTGSVFHFKYVGEEANEPIISAMSKKFTVDVNILHGHITELQGRSLGNLIVELRGLREDIDKAIYFASSNQVIVKEVHTDGSRARHYLESVPRNVVYG